MGKWWRFAWGWGCGKVDGLIEGGLGCGEVELRRLFGVDLGGGWGEF